MPTSFRQLSGGPASEIPYKEKHSLRLEPAPPVNLGIFWKAEIVAMRETTAGMARATVIDKDGHVISNPDWGIARWYDSAKKSARAYFTNDFSYNAVELFSLEEAYVGIYSPNKPEDGNAPFRFWLYGPNMISEAAWFGSIDDHISQAMTIRVTPLQTNPL